MSDDETDEAKRYIPAPLRRRVMVEAGHRCAILTCRQTSGLEVHHIDDWAKVREHRFENLICLCAVRHHRATIGEIDRLAMLQYKANLSVLTSKYGDYERRVLEYFTLAGEPLADLMVVLPGGRDLDLWYLLRDGLLKKAPPSDVGSATGVTLSHNGRPTQDGYRLTELGVQFVEALQAARPLD